MDPLKNTVGYFNPEEGYNKFDEQLTMAVTPATCTCTIL